MTTILDDIKRALNRPSVSVADVARATGVAYNTVKSIRDGTGNPTWQTITTIANDLHSRYLAGQKCDNCTHNVMTLWDDSVVCGVARSSNSPGVVEGSTACLLHCETGEDDATS